MMDKGKVIHDYSENEKRQLALQQLQQWFA
jgi:ABC-type uncharacterized transport system ATPase component